MEQKLKALLGEYAFALAGLQAQVETLQKELEDLRSKKDKK